MKKLFSFLVCALIALSLSAIPKTFATDIDILDVKTTFKVGGADKTKVVVATGTNSAIAYGVKSVTGSSTFSSGLGTVTCVLDTLDTISATNAHVTGTSSGANVTLKVYGTDTTTLATGASIVQWLAIGTP